VVTLCRKAHLHSALVYLYTQGLNDYVTPLQDMMDYASAQLSTVTSVAQVESRTTVTTTFSFFFLLGQQKVNDMFFFPLLCDSTTAGF
jgi:hypothetical protein